MRDDDEGSSFGSTGQEMKLLEQVCSFLDKPTRLTLAPTEKLSWSDTGWLRMVEELQAAISTLQAPDRNGEN